jgi:hypothetical protein
MAGDDKVKLTIRLPRELLRRTKHYAIDHDADVQDVVAEALTAFLAKKGGK